MNEELRCFLKTSQNRSSPEPLHELRTSLLLNRSVSKIQVSAQHRRPIFQDQRTIVPDITRTGLNHQNALVGQISGKTASNYASCRTTTNNDIVKVAILALREYIRDAHDESEDARYMKLLDFCTRVQAKGKDL